MTKQKLTLNDAVILAAKQKTAHYVVATACGFAVQPNQPVISNYIRACNDRAFMVDNGTETELRKK